MVCEVRKDGLRGASQWFDFFCHMQTAPMRSEKSKMFSCFVPVSQRTPFSFIMMLSYW